MKCEQHDCEKQADYIVMWPNQVTKQCSDHAYKLVNLGKVMGIQIPLLAILGIEDDQ